MEQRPNLLFVFSDQHRYFDLGCNGNEQVFTPHFDAFAREGLRVTQCISNCPVCVPIRGSMLTGRTPLHHGALTNDFPLRRGTESIADVMNAAGYATGYIGKWHLAGIPRDRFVPEEERFGFQEWRVSNCNHHYLDSYYDDEENVRHPIEGYDAITQADQAIDFMTRHQRTPWGLVLSWGPPHGPYREEPEAFMERYAPEKLCLRDNVQFLANNGATTKDEAAVRKWLQGYYGHITALDEQFGRLLEALEATGQRENTIVVYTSDHGDMMASHGQTEKMVPYEEAARVPLLLRWPGHIQPGVQEGQIGLVDLPVGLMELAGLRFSGAVDGWRCASFLSDPAAPGLDTVDMYCYIPCAGVQARGVSEWRGLRTERFTYARNADETQTWFFDNAADPYQRENLFGCAQWAQQQAELEAQLQERLLQQGDELLPWREYA